MMRAQNEAWSISSSTTFSYCILTLAGGASPNNQAGDVVMVLAFEGN
jgi:hypothetical protein